MPVYSVQGPDGRIYDVEGPTGASEAEILSFVAEHASELPSKRSGLTGALGKGIESTLSQLRTGVQGAFSPEEAAKAGIERGKKIGEKYDEQVSLDKVLQAYKERGILPAAGEALSQVPAALLEQFPNIGATVAAGRAGAALGSLAGPAGTIGGGLLGAALPSLVQQFGGNIERQAEEGKPVSRAAALGAAVPQAALDVAGTFVPLGGRLVSKLTGIPERALLADASGKAAKLAEERLLTTLTKGTAIGAAAEIPTEVAQQMLERAQAGLSLTDASALKEYGETAYQVGLLAPMGTAGRLTDRMAARNEQARQKEEERQRLMAEDLQREEAARAAKKAAAEQQAIIASGADLVQQAGIDEAGGLTPEGKIAAAREELAKHEETLAQISRVVPILESQLADAQQKNDLATVGKIGKQLAELQDQERAALRGQRTLNKIIPAEADYDTLQAKLKAAIDSQDYAKVAELSARLQATPKTEMPGLKQPVIQEDMFSPEWEKAQLKKDITDIQEGFGPQPAYPEKTPKTQAQQTALFEQGEELAGTLTEKQMGQMFELTPEQYADALRNGFAAPEQPAAQKVLYRQVPTEKGTQRVPYIVDEQGKARDLTPVEAAKLEQAQPELPPPTKQAVSTAIDSGLITPAVKQALGLSGLGRSVIDLNTEEGANAAIEQLRAKINESKAQSQALLQTFIDDPLAENNLYDMNGRMTEAAKDVIRRDVQTQEAERLLNHILERQRQSREVLREDTTAKELTKTLYRPEAVSTELPPMEQMSVQDQSELNKALGVTGAAEIGNVPQDRVSAMRHRLEARRQAAAKTAAYNDLLELLEALKTSKQPHPLDSKRLTDLRAAYVQAALKEAAHIRAAEQRPGLTAAEVMESSGELHTALKELTTRYLAKPPAGEEVGKQTALTYAEPFGGEKIEQTTVDKTGTPLFTEVFTERKPRTERQLQQTVGRLRAKQNELQRASTQLNNFTTNFLEPSRQAWQNTPEGPEREARQAKYLELKAKGEEMSRRTQQLTDDLVYGIRNAGLPRATYQTIEQDLRDLSERPFGNTKAALEAIQEHLGEISTRLVGEKPAPRRVAVTPIGRAQNLLDRIKAKEQELKAVKGEHGGAQKRAKLEAEIASLRDQYNQAAEKEQPTKEREQVLAFAERRNQMESLQADIKAAYEAKDYAKTTALTRKLRELELDEEDANEIGADLERNDRVLLAAIKETQQQLQTIATGEKAAPQEVRLGQRVQPKGALNADQLQEMKRLNKLLDQLERAYVNNKGAMESVGLYSGNVDTLTEDMFGTAPELGTVFETPEQYLGSAKSGKIAKLRKAARDITNTLPVSLSDVYRARTEYIAATTVLQAVRKAGGKDVSAAQYFRMMEGEYLRQADAVSKKRAGESEDASKSGWEGKEWYNQEYKRLMELAKLAGARAEYFLTTLTEKQADAMYEFNAAAKDVDIETADGLVFAQAMVNRAKAEMDSMDALAKKNGVIAPVKAEKEEIKKETPTERLARERAETVKQISDLKAQAKDATEDDKVVLDAKIKALVQHENFLTTEIDMRTAEGRLKRMMDNFLAEFGADIDPTAPLESALGRAYARSREYIPETAQAVQQELQEAIAARGDIALEIARFAKKPPPTNKQAFLEFNMDAYELQDKLDSINNKIESLQNQITAAQNGEVQMLLRADYAVKEAWKRVKAAEAALRAEDRKGFEALVQRKAALIKAQQLIEEARSRRARQQREIQQRIDSGFGLPGTRVSKASVFSEEGRKVAELSPDKTVQTMNPGWSVTYTEDGPRFSYDPKNDPDATDADKKRKALSANKAADQLKKARSKYNKALDSKNATAIEATKQQLEEKQRQLEEMAGARYVRVVEQIGADPTEVDQEIAVQEALTGLSTKDKNAYFKARADQLAAKKNIEHIRSLKGETELSDMQKAQRNIEERIKEVKAKATSNQSDLESGLLSQQAYDNRKKNTDAELANLEARKAEVEFKLKPREKAHEAKLKAATDAYFAAKRTADAFILPKPVAEAPAQRAPVAENVADMASTMRTLASQEKTSSDIKPLRKVNNQLRTQPTSDAQIQRTAAKLAKKDRLVTMYAKGSPEYERALKEVTRGYVNKLADAESTGGGTVLRVEGAPPPNPVDAAQAQKAADAYKAGLPKDVKFVYAPTLREAPVKFLRALAEDNIDLDTVAVKGGVLPDGTIVVIGNMHTSLKDLEETLVHEAIGHYGVDMVLGPDGMKGLVQAIRTADGGIVGMAKALGVEREVVNTAMVYEQRARDLDAAGDKGGAILERRKGETQAVREMLAHLSEQQVTESFLQKAGRWIKTVVGAIRAAFKKIGFVNTASVSTSDLYYTLFRASRRMQQELAGTYKSPVGLLSLRSEQIAYATPELANAGATVDKIIAKDRNWYDSVKANGTGLAFETQYVDRFAGFERLSKYMDELKGSQMMYYLRMYDQRMHFVAQSVENGALQRVAKKRKDGRTEYLIEAVDGPSIRGVARILRDAPAGSPDAANRLFTLYMAAIRARNKGVDVLNFSERITESELEKAVRAIEATPGLKEKFDLARKEYNAYNRNLIKFLRDSGAISEATADALVKEDDYIPWYRQRNGVVELVIGSETPIRIGSIAEQPYLQELVGGDKPILDFLTSSVQNTNMIVDMGLRNLATRNAVFELQELGMARIGRKKIVGPNVVHFKIHPEDEKDTGDRYAYVDGTREIPGDLLVKGMEGIPTQLTGIMRLMSKPATFLRKAVTASPLYAAKQLFRDSTAAAIISGADFTPVMGALKEIGSPTKAVLERRGIVGGQIFTGTAEDLTRTLKRITESDPGWLNSLAKWETIAMEADAVTRRAQYNSYIKQGLSEMEATLMSLESMNFNKRGASPSMHVIGSLIPFFNAQIQGLNVLYKALRGKLPFSERLRIQEKMYTRGLMMASATFAYAAMMQDDEAYKNATPDQKYGNWFLRIPGVDEPVRIPVPFEIGYIFKALPEAIYNSAVNEHGDEEAIKAFKQILLQTLPGGTSYGLPQAIKPLVEYKLGKSFYTGRDILTAHEKGLMPEAQYRDNTSEAAKALGATMGVSPIEIEELVRGYTSGLGVALLQAISIGIPKGESPEKAYKRLSEMPLVGSAFQPNDAGGIITSTYERMDELKKVKNTVDDYLTRGQKAEALELLAKKGNEYVASEMSDYFTTTMRELTQYEIAVRASGLTPQEKRDKLDELRRLKITLANTIRQAADKTIPQ